MGENKGYDTHGISGGQPVACARVGAGNDASNHRWTGSLKAADLGNESAPRASNDPRDGPCVITTRNGMRNIGVRCASKEDVNSWTVGQSDRQVISSVSKGMRGRKDAARPQ